MPGPVSDIFTTISLFFGTTAAIILTVPSLVNSSTTVSLNSRFVLLDAVLYKSFISSYRLYPTTSS